MKTDTCGSLYKKAVAAMSGSFLAGFIAGQAEKVYSGACGACMVKPTPIELDTALQDAEAAAGVYGLLTISFGHEIWLFHKDAGEQMRRMSNLVVNSPEYHRARATLCGIRDVDEKFHERIVDRADKS